VGATPLPGGPWQRLPDRLDEATVRIGDHEYHPGEPACHERAPASEPAGLVLAGGDPGAEDLAVALSIHPSDDEHVDIDGPAGLSYLDHQGIRPDDRVRTAVQGDGRERPSPPHRGCGPSCEIWDFDSFVIPRAQASFSGSS